jgi:hypothetical protein
LFFHIFLICIYYFSSLHDTDPSEILSGLEKEELTLKNLKNFYMEELERIQLEENLLTRQLEHVQQNVINI